jgi:hypothetical protein
VDLEAKDMMLLLLVCPSWTTKTCKKYMYRGTEVQKHACPTCNINADPEITLRNINIAFRLRAYVAADHLYCSAGRASSFRLPNDFLTSYILHTLFVTTSLRGAHAIEQGKEPCLYKVLHA